MESPKGKLIAVGGNENKGDESPEEFYESGILKRVLKECKGIDSRIEVITTASGVPKETGDNYLKAFEKLGAKNIGVMHIKKRDLASETECLQRLKEADGVMFSGGDQLQIAMILGGTDFHEVLKERYLNESFVIAGTSAGAMAMSTTMIYGGSSVHALIKDEVKFNPGLGLINAIIDTHFMHRGRFGRLAQAVTRNPGCLGVGIGEDTGVVITRGSMIETVGSGFVIIVDGHDIHYSNALVAGEGSPLSIEGLKVHVLAKGNCFNLNQRKFYTSLDELMAHA
jgi:cyanophycinase